MEPLPLPDNLDCERFVLGALFGTAPTQTPVEAILASLEPTDFSLEKHRIIYRRMVDIQQRGGTIDRVTLAEELRKNKQLQSVDGLAYLVSLDDGLPYLHDLDSYIGILRDKSMLRKLITDIASIQQRAYRGESPSDLAEEMRRIGEGLQPKGSDAGLETPEQVIDRVGINELITPPKGKLGIEPPFAWLRNRMRFEPKTFTVLAAETGHGKSAFALQAMLCAAHAGHRTAMYTMEMSNEQEVVRLIGQSGKLNMHRLRIGEGDREEIRKASAAAGKIMELGDMLLLRDAGTVTIPMIRQDLMRWKSTGKEIKFLIADYLQLMSGVGKFDNRTGEVAGVSRGLKLISQDFGIPVLALSQFKRPTDGKKGKRGMDDLKESSGIPQDANHVILLECLTENEEAEEQRFLMHLKKQRSGPKGHGHLTFTQRYTRFDETEAA